MKNIALELYYKMFLIRTAEESIQQNYLQDDMKTPMHMSMGAEAIAAGTCQALNPQDQVLVTYRSHAVYLAKTLETNKFFAEMYGKVTGVAKGKGGSMHLVAPNAGFLGASAIVASNIPVAVGVAFANQVNNNGRTVVVYFGDGAIDEGVFWESINMACLHQLRVLFVCEDNEFAVHVPARHRHGYESIDKIIGQFNCNTVSSESTDADVIYDLTADILKKMHNNGQPGFMHLKYYRYLEHVGVFDDFKAGYRDRAEFDDWKKVDPLRLQRQKLISAGLHDAVNKLETEIVLKIRQSITLAQQADYPPKNVCYEDVYV